MQLDLVPFFPLVVMLVVALASPLFLEGDGLLASLASRVCQRELDPPVGAVSP
jgi:hypothetical protein